MATRVITVNDILDGHVGLDLECFDRIYLNGWVPNLQVSGLDAIVVVDAYQEVEDRVTFLQNLARALKPNGLIGVVNWNPGRGGPGPPENARVDKASVISDVRAAGLRIVDEETLPYQYLLVLAR